MSGKLRYYNPKTKKYELVTSGGIYAENKNKTLKGDELIDELDNKANKNDVVNSINGKKGVVEIDGNDIKYNQWSTINEEINLKANTWDLLDKADKSYVDTEIGKIPKIFHDKTDGSVTEDKKPSWFDIGITVCNHGSKSNFPSIYEFGVSITFKGTNSNFGQIFITADGDIWSRRSNSTSSWRSWYSIKKEIDKKADKSHKHSAYDIDETSSQKFVSENEKLKIKEIDNKADKNHKHSALDIDETYSRKFVTGSQLSNIDKIPNKADKSYVDEKINDIDINQFEVIDKGGYSFDNLKEAGVYRLWNSSTSPCRSTTDYITAVFTYSNKVTQVAYSSTTTSSRENRVYTRYYTGSRWTDWRELTNVDVEKEIDNLKQSGVEINKILVDALNSKGVWASTSGSIKTNANKVKNIQVGDYSVGDVIDVAKLKPVWNDKNPTALWEYLVGSTVNAIAVDRDGYVYSGSTDEKVMKISPQGHKVWEFTGHSYSVQAVAVDRDGYVYSADSKTTTSSGGDDKKIMKISPQGNKVWEFTGHYGIVYSVAVDDNGYVYVGVSRRVIKISPQGSKVWEFTGHNSTVNAVAVDRDGYVYSGSDDNKVMKISPSGSKVWEFTGHSNWVNAIAVDDKGYVYSGSWDKKVMKISPSGSKVWEYSVGSRVNAIAVDYKGYVYSGINDYKVMKISPNGSLVWEYRRDGRVYSVAVDDNGYVYSGSNDNKVMKISPGNLIGYKIIA